MVIQYNRSVKLCGVLVSSFLHKSRLTLGLGLLVSTEAKASRFHVRRFGFVDDKIPTSGIKRYGIYGFWIVELSSL